LARKVLLADDSVTAQNMGRKILADAGYDVITVNNGSAALKRITEIKPDLIVLDVYMPGYSGLEVCQRLKEGADTARIPVLLTVGKLEPFKAEEARLVRADAHIVKPFEASELLAAITRLEDRRVAQSAESDSSADTGWKSRLSFPSKKKKAGTEAEEGSAGATFRDFRRGKGKNGASGTLPVQKAAPAQDPVPVPEIPRDITPEELDALSALAAKLDAPTAAAEDTSPPAKQEFETPAPVIEPSVESVDAALAAEPAASAVESVEEKSEFEIPVEHMQPAVEGSAPVAEPAAVEVGKPDLEDAESQRPETPAAVVAVNTAELAQEPAPVDRSDEPIFASAASAVEQAAEEKIQEKPAEAEEPAPSDTELAEALRLLTPATGNADVSTVPSREALVAAGQMLAEEVAHNLAATPRWVAEPVALSPDEAAISLEAEMFRTFAAVPASLGASSSAPEFESARITSVSAIAAAVENRLAEAGLAASSQALADGPESCAETTAKEAAAQEAPAEAVPEVSNATTPVVGGVETLTKDADSPVKVAEQVPTEEATAHEAPKAMAATAAEGSAPASDANAIANIVDSVLADLRPKIMEEIAKKLAGK